MALIFLGILVVIVILLVGMYNSLVQLRVRCDNAWSDIDVQLKRRHDLIPNLVETVKGYAAHEKGTFENIAKFRSQAMQATTPGDKAQAENQLSGALKSLFAVAENYPQLNRPQGTRALGPREIDLDLLVFGRHQVHIERPDRRWLEVPHPEWLESHWALADIALHLDTRLWRRSLFAALRPHEPWAVDGLGAAGSALSPSSGWWAAYLGRGRGTSLRIWPRHGDVRGAVATRPPALRDRVDACPWSRRSTPLAWPAAP